MTPRAHLLLAAAAVLLWGCGGLSSGAPADGGVLIVPASYHEASVTGGHVKHVGQPRPDGGNIACRDCHDVDVKGFEDPGLGACKSCHEDQAGYHHTADAGLADGGQVTCMSCHPFWVRQGAQPLTPWICQDCHREAQGQKREVEAHASACFFCHQPHREPFTRPPDCVVCHEVGLVHGAKGDTVAQTCMKCHEQHRPAAEATKVCVACHSDEKEQKTAATRVTEKALFKGHGSCGACHKPHRFAKNEVKACEACHKNQPVLAKGLSPKAHPTCVSCHAPHAANQPPKTCESCHKDIPATHPVTPELPACMSCHPVHQELPRGVAVKDCESCHKEAEFQAVVHGKDDKGQPLSCSSCHKPHQYFVKKGDQASCKECHGPILTATAKVKKQGHAKCADCHAGLPHKPADSPKGCTECHKDKPSTGKGHVKCLDCHEKHDGSTEKGCVACHKLAELEGLHAEKKHQTCGDCHTVHSRKPGYQRDGCLACHKEQVNHEPKAERCTGCHLFEEPTSPPVQKK